MHIFCLGDSNTYGYDPRSFFGERYSADVRWTGCFARLNACHVLEHGQNGRAVPHRPEETAALLKILLNSEFDFLLIMLGTNDILQGNKAKEAAKRMSLFISNLDGIKDKTILIAPPHLCPGEWTADVNVINESYELGKEYARIAHEKKLKFIDASGWDIELCYDGVHYTSRGHARFANMLYNEISAIKEKNNA